MLKNIRYNCCNSLLSPRQFERNPVFYMGYLIIGIGGNVWVNEYVYILFPVLLVAGFRGWPLETVYRYTGTTVKNGFLSILSGVGIWLFGAYLSRVINNILEKLGTYSIDTKALGNTPIQSVLYLIALVVLAPIC